MWSTTLFSYGDEYRNFSIQIIFSYDSDLKFTKGNGYSGMTIQNSSILSRARSAELPILEIKEGVYKVVTSPGGYRFFIIDKPEPSQADPIQKIHLMCSDEMNVLMFWHCVLGAKVNSHYFNHSTVVSFQDHGVKFKFRKTDEPIVIPSHGCRLTLSTTIDKLRELEKFMMDEHLEITFPLTPLNVSHDGHVLTMMVEDFDGHEIALVDEIDYDRQAIIDVAADEMLMMAMRKEKIYRGENPVVDENDARFFNFLDIFEDHEKCRGKNSFRILGPLVLPAYLMKDN
uniref:Glyoxalase domain-containing protein 4 n=1 Tax=Lygus hesperus TaxID=30085 RepID=A0A0A9YTW6_LYGHE